MPDTIDQTKEAGWGYLPLAMGLLPFLGAIGDKGEKDIRKYGPSHATRGDLARKARSGDVLVSGEVPEVFANNSLFSILTDPKKIREAAGTNVMRFGAPIGAPGLHHADIVLEDNVRDPYLLTNNRSLKQMRPDRSYVLARPRLSDKGRAEYEGNLQWVLDNERATEDELRKQLAKAFPGNSQMIEDAVEAYNKAHYEGRAKQHAERGFAKLLLPKNVSGTLDSPFGDDKSYLENIESIRKLKADPTRRADYVSEVVKAFDPANPKDISPRMRELCEMGVCSTSPVELLPTSPRFVSKKHVKYVMPSDILNSPNYEILGHYTPENTPHKTYKMLRHTPNVLRGLLGLGLAGTTALGQYGIRKLFAPKKKWYEELGSALKNGDLSGVAKAARRGGVAALKSLGL